MATPRSPKIIIIGGGIGGLMTAIALNKKGITATIYEKAPALEPNGAGLGLWANATSILDHHGLLAALKPKGNVLKQLKTSTSAGKPLKTVGIGKLEAKLHYPSMVVLRSDLQESLLNAIPDGQIVYGKHCIQVESQLNTTTVHFADGSSETADALNFADGVHSVAREQIFRLPPLTYAGRTSWRGIATLPDDLFEPNCSFEIYGKGKRMGIFPLPNRQVYWFAAINMPEATASTQERTRKAVQAHLQDWAEPVQTLLNSTPEDRLILTPIHYERQEHPIVQGNIALLGDAAHPMTPDLGQGACQAIEDAVAIAECLSEAPSIAEAFQAYQQRRLERVRSVAKNSYRSGKMRQAESSIGMAFRNTIFRCTPERIFLKVFQRIVDPQQ